MVKKVYFDGYFGTIYEVQRYIGKWYKVDDIPEDMLNKLVYIAWSDDNWNIVKRMKQLRKWQVKDVTNIVTKAIEFERPLSDTLFKLSQISHKEKVRMGRITRTEQAFYNSLAQFKAYKILGIEKYQIIAVIDDRTSDICRSLNGTSYLLDDYEVCVTAPPFHPNCRSTTRPYVDEIEESLIERNTRDKETGEVDMTYKEWLEKYKVQDGQDKSKGKRFAGKSGQMQYYKELKIDTEDEVKLEHFYKNINAKKISSTYNDNIYLSESVKNVKARKIHELDIALSKTYKILGEDNIKNFEKPNIVIVSNEEMSKMIPASYSLVKNTIFLHEELFKISDKVKELQVGYVEPTKLLSTILHENIHWYDLQRYVYKNGVINSQQAYNKYTKYLNEKFKNTIENNGAIIYNVSRYATISYGKGKYDEVFTEYRVSKLLKGNSFNNLQDDDIKYGYDDIKEMQRLWKDVKPYLLQNIDIDRVEMDDLFIKKTPLSIIKKYNQYKSLYDNRYGL